MKLVKVLAVVMVITISLLLQLGAVKADSVKVYGYVYDIKGKPASSIEVFCGTLSGSDFVYGSTTTDDQGYYSLSMRRPQRLNVPIPDERGRPVFEGCRMFVAWPSPERSVRWLPILSSINTEGKNVVEQDFTVKPAGRLIPRAYNAGGAPITSFDWETTTPVYTTDFNWTITPGIFIYGQSTLVLAINTSHVINFPWEVPGFGKVILRADNDGKGYPITRQGETVSINLSYELARTEYRLLLDSYKEYLVEGYILSSGLSSQIQFARTLLENATHTPTDSDKAHFADLCLNRTLWAAESLELEKASQDIEKYRKGNATVTFVDENGRPIEGADVEITQISHDFLFGANPEGPELDLTAYKLLAQAGINFGRFDFCWWNMERPLGTYHTDENPPSLFRWLKETGYRLGAECLVLLESGPNTYDTGLVNLNYEQLKAKIYEHVHRLVSEYSDSIHIWTIAHNIHRQYDTLGYNPQQVMDLIGTGIEAVRSADPEARILVMFDDPAGDDSGVDDTGAYTYFLQLREHGLRVDEIELVEEYGSLYEFPSGFFLSQTQVPHAFMDLASISRNLDWYNTLSVPIHMETHAPANFKSNLGYWHRTSWDEQLQAEWIEKMYTIAFSKPFMKEITYYAFKDKDYQTANRGLLDVNYTPRQSFYTLQRLITKEWTTRLETKTDANGQVKFRGFAGNYTITIRTENGLVNSTIHVNEQANQAYTIKTVQPSTHVAGMVEAEQAIANATEAVNKAKTEGRTIFLDKAESLLRESQKALSEEDYRQATLLAEEANQAANNAVTWLVIPVTAVVGVVLSAVVLLRKRAKKA